MAVLMIGITEREKIAKIIVYAKAHPVSFETIHQGAMDDKAVLELKDRKRTDTVRPASAHIMFPGGFHAAFSIEQQPPGLCSHLSISVEGRAKKGMMPSEPAVQMICQEFGVPYPADKIWIEEFSPGEFAVNLVSLYAPTQEGHA
jgi:hypothetical protein